MLFLRLSIFQIWLKRQHDHMAESHVLDPYKLKHGSWFSPNIPIYIMFLLEMQSLNDMFNR